MKAQHANKDAQVLKEHVHPLQGQTSDYDVLMERIGDASIVLLGEATHGTHEFYKARADITKRLIQEKGFGLVAIEGDWPDAYRANRYVQGQSDDRSAQEALDDFKRFPTWMWRNQEIVELVEWLRNHNVRQPKQARVGWYGMDVYSLHRSMEIVIEYLETVDKNAAVRARERYGCFDRFGAESQDYGYFATLYPSTSCRDKVVEQLVELTQKDLTFFKTNALNAYEQKLYIEQNARVVENAERYYRSLFEGDSALSWNIRDHHMVETLSLLLDFAGESGMQQKIIVWAHNSHLGDARATQMSARSEVNVGQLMREHYGEAVVSVGFTTYTGTVSAASGWDQPVERKHVRPALEGSYEALFHAVGSADFVVRTDDPAVQALLSEPRLERAIGVIYVPQTERQSHYFYANIVQQFDIVMHFDTTHAVHPLEKTAEWQAGEFPETYPFGV